MDKQALLKEELANVLQKLYIGARKQNGDYHKLTAFEASGQGSARHFRERKNWEIIKETEVQATNTTDYSIQMKPKKLGKGKIDHHYEIESVQWV